MLCGATNDFGKSDIQRFKSYNQKFFCFGEISRVFYTIEFTATKTKPQHKNKNHFVQVQHYINVDHWNDSLKINKSLYAYLLRNVTRFQADLDL